MGFSAVADRCHVARKQKVREQCNARSSHSQWPSCGVCSLESGWNRIPSWPQTTTPGRSLDETSECSRRTLCDDVSLWSTTRRESACLKKEGKNAPCPSSGDQRQQREKIASILEGRKKSHLRGRMSVKEGEVKEGL